MAEDFEPQTTETTPERKHEIKDVKSSPIIIAMIVIMIIIGVIHIFLLGLGWWYNRQHQTNYAPVSALETVPVVPPAPRLQSDPTQDMQALLTMENALVATYGWSDRKANLARIPIDQALDLVAERGLPPKTIDISTSWTWNTSR